jgi:glycosyltransferase involved in cell wall biosynthesis
MPSAAEPLRILTITHNYPRFAGDPAGAFVARIAEGIAARGHEVRVLAPHAPELSINERIGGVGVRRFRYAPERFERLAYTGALHQGALRSPVLAAALPAFLLAFDREARKAVDEFRPHLVHAHWWFPSGWLARRTGRPYVITCHGSDVRLLERGRLVRRSAGAVLGRAARVTVVSEFLSRDLRRLLPSLPASITVTPMPVAVDSFVAGGSATKVVPPRILYAGNLVSSKGVDLLLTAAADLARDGIDYQLKILGKGPEESSLRALAQRLGIDSRIEWSPFVSQARMPGEYGASTITVLPSRGQAEGLGLTLVEAMLAGSAVVGTPAGGIPEVIRHEETGLLARDGDAGDLARQIKRLLTDGALRDRLTRAGKEHVSQLFAPSSAVDRFLAIYNAAADHNANR